MRTIHMVFRQLSKGCFKILQELNKNIQRTHFISGLTPCWAYCLVSLQKIAISLTVMAAKRRHAPTPIKEAQTDSMSLQFFFPAFVVFLQFRSFTGKDINKDTLFCG